jgi:hypothetical protein
MSGDNFIDIHGHDVIKNLYPALNICFPKKGMKIVEKYIPGE